MMMNRFIDVGGLATERRKWPLSSFSLQTSPFLSLSSSAARSRSRSHSNTNIQSAIRNGHSTLGDKNELTFARVVFVVALDSYVQHTSHTIRTKPFSSAYFTWLLCFACFVVSFCLSMSEDQHTNRMIDSLALFTQGSSRGLT